MILGYKGRFVGAGLTGDGRIYLLHAATARSEPNKKRKAVTHPDRIFIQHLEPDSVTPEQLAEIQYNALRIVDEGLAVVSNGEQTDGLAKEYFDPAIMERELQRLGYERDGTPRIAIRVDERYKKLDKSVVRFGIVAKHTESGEKLIRTEPRILALGKVHYVTTYTGDSREIVLPDVRYAPQFKRLINIIDMKGASPQELSDEFYGLLNPDYAVCTDVAMWFEDRGEWQFGVRNLHG